MAAMKLSHDPLDLTEVAEEERAELCCLLQDRLDADPSEDEILTPELWRRLTTGDYVEISPDSLAVPPGWRK